MEDVGLGVVLEMTEVPPVGREALQGMRGALRAGARPGPPPHARTLAQTRRDTPSSAPGSPPPILPPHLQLPHHKLLGHVVPLGLPEDRGMAQVMLQTPGLSLGTEAGSGAGGREPGGLPAPRAPPQLMLRFKTLWATFLFLTDEDN